MWLIVLSLSPHNLHLLFCRILSILALTYLVLMVLFCAAINKDSVSLKRFPFFRHVQVFSWEISLVYRLKYPYTCFSTHFFLVIFVLLKLVLSLLFLEAVISFPPRFFMLSSCIDVSIFSYQSSRIDVSILSWMSASHLLPSWMLVRPFYYHHYYFTVALTDGFSVESEWRQVSSVLQDFSQYFITTITVNIIAF